MGVQADLIFTGGPIFTGRRTRSGEWEIAEAAAVKGDRVAAVGRAAEVMQLQGAGTRVRQLHGRTLMAGFNDAHLHLAIYGTNMLDVNCKVLGSIAEITKAVAAEARTRPPGTWVRGWGYNQMKLKEGRHPTRWDLDAAAPDHPVMLLRTCAHIAVFNTRALALLGIGDHDPDPPGGEYERVDGVVSGVCKEQAHMRHTGVTGHTDEELVEGLALASRDLLSRGVTSIHDMGGTVGAKTWRAFQRGVQSGACQVRVYAIVWSFDDLALHRAVFDTGLCTGFGDDRLRLGHFKIMVDGASSGPTAKMRQPYAIDPAYDGILHMEPEVAVERIVEAHRRGFPCTAHAVGDRAIEIMLDAYTEAQRRYPRPGVRHRLEHCVTCTPDLRARMKELGVIPVPQPTWFQDFGDGYIRNYGEWRVAHFKPLRSWLDDGFIPALSTDCPVTYADPFLNLYAAVTRETGSGVVAPGAEQVSLPEALWMYTYGSAYAEYAESRKGTVAPGMLADLIVLDRDLLSTPALEMRQTRVDMTVVGGQVLYERR